MDKEHILNEIKRTTISNGGIPLGMDRFLKETGIRITNWKGKYWINWSDAVKEAGFVPNDFKQSYEDEFLLSKVASYIRILGHFPQIAELKIQRNKDPSFPDEGAFRRWGTKVFFAKAVYEWCENKAEWNDVAALCYELQSQAIEKPVNIEEDAPEPNGFVYLMKSGKHYKIGRTNAIDRRQYEIGLQLPLGITPIHNIATDDASGIEAYWHNRF
jgi:hypothetical protein